MQRVTGDLLDSQCDVLVQQLNCLTLRPHGLSQDLADRFPYCNVYGKRNPASGRSNLACKSDRPRPGHIKVSKPPTENGSNTDIYRPVVIGIFGQWSCGTPGRYYKYVKVPGESGPETKRMRERWFRDGLTALLFWIRIQPELKMKIGFPYQIGCGMAGGNWDAYESMLEQFTARARQLAPAKDISVHIYCRPEDCK